MDGLRAVAALAVVMIHVSAGRMNPVGVSCNQIARFAVPLFIMLSGYGHMYSWLQHSGQSAVQTAKRRLKRVLPAYLIWSVLYLAVDAVFGKPHAHPIKNILTGGSYVHLYYIFILVQLILLSELFCRAVERHPAVTLLLSAGLTFGMEIVIYLLTVGRLQWQFPVAPISLFVCWPLFYNIGAWLAKSGLSNRLRLRVCLPLWVLSAVLVLLTEEHSAAAYKMGLRPDATVYTLLTWAVLWACSAGCRRFRSRCSLLRGIPSDCIWHIRWCCACGTNGRHGSRRLLICGCGRCLRLRLRADWRLRSHCLICRSASIWAAQNVERKSCKGEHNGKKENRRTKSI